MISTQGKCISIISVRWVLIGTVKVQFGIFWNYYMSQRWTNTWILRFEIVLTVIGCATREHVTQFEWGDYNLQVQKVI